jgi:hypothetical protein
MHSALNYPNVTTMTKNQILIIYCFLVFDYLVATIVCLEVEV